MRRVLRELADNFERVRPSSGRYVPYPAVTDERGVVRTCRRSRVTPCRAAPLRQRASVSGSASG
jgi:hypothetical protein